MAFEVKPRKAYSKNGPREQIKMDAPQQSLPQYDVPVTQIHNPSFDAICWIKHLNISSENHLVFSERSQSFLWHSKSKISKHVLRVVHVSRVTLLLLNNDVNCF
jgi:hypothetical protein